MNGSLAASSLAISLALYAWAIRYYFSTTAITPCGMRLLAIAGTLSGICQCAVLFSSTLALSALLAGTALHLAGISLFVWVLASVPRSRLPVAHSPTQSQSLSTHGPFALFRHPCYLSYSLTWLGACVAHPHWATFLPACTMLTWYVCLAIGEERHIAKSPLSFTYAQYCSRVSWIGPKLFASQCAVAASKEPQGTDS